MTATDTERLPQAGTAATLTKTISVEDIEAFAALSGDRNPLHLDASFARQTRFQRPVAHGMLVAGFISTMVGMQLPGAGALWTRQSFDWRLPVYAGDTLVFTLRVRHASHATNTVAIEVNAVNQNGQIVMEGEGAVMMVEQMMPALQPTAPRGAALITGASRGIGAAVATRLAEAGFAVGVNYLRSQDEAGELCRQIREAGGVAVALEADVTKLAQVKDATERLQQTSGRPVTVMVHCASLPISLKPFLESSWEEAQHVLDVQVKGAWNSAQAVLPGMLSNSGGTIVFLGSAMTSTAPPQWTAFLLAKSALQSLMRSLAAEFGPAGVRVNMVSPGITNTATVAAISERLRKVQAMQAPLRRTIGMDEVAQTVAFLCSENASALTGIDVPVCGGAVMR